MQFDGAKRGTGFRQYVGARECAGCSEAYQVRCSGQHWQGTGGRRCLGVRLRHSVRLDLAHVILQRPQWVPWIEGSRPCSCIWKLVVDRVVVCNVILVPDVLQVKPKFEIWCLCGTLMPDRRYAHDGGRVKVGVEVSER